MDPKCANVLVTGGEGYIGSCLVIYLKPFVKEVISYDIIQGDDIFDFDKLVLCITNNRIDVVIHLAALSSVTACNEDNNKAILINGIGTKTLVLAMEKAGCRHIIYASTSSVYGDSKILPYNINSPTIPCSPYGSTKLLGETMLKEYFDKNYLIFRMFNVVGRPKGSIISTGYDRLFGALESGTITVYGTEYLTKDGTCERDYVSIDDVCEAYLLGIKTLLREDIILREVVNICTGQPTSVKEIISKWNKISNEELKVSYGESRIGDPEIVYGTTHEAQNLIGWIATRKIEDIITLLVKHK